ncbi:ComEA family DNA-binding protein [Rheinheimera muenzenbergensis]|uniref:ComEA family DNA-binding protein n=1 Tax=Rheinheimera muenzenbergensis TaxID=1193628 RepID=A0ABU8CBI6_9GAMM|nr:ComEA family DNA-binding protein [Gammaproteobacteria bacterium]MBU1554849.1 ComEA family DNA-binding protein [Gammaproteobacteria bacterium]MBU2071800.1 ComEA family DNA-binding protein [Gammaproteobacteria bacterium]MBU2184132.1 ComEA family DNA-binding protein [Gammaproteobacteria bacterium]MBU2204285.1 ComEA family DNA-binding protein [Gammaproteobacteria bacterium]
MKQIFFAIAMTILAVSANLAFADAKTSSPISKTDVAVQKVSVNTASLEQLDAIPGLGKKKAQAVLDHIAQHGPIQNQADLTKVKGIGDKLAAKISPYLSFN